MSEPARDRCHMAVVSRRAAPQRSTSGLGTGTNEREPPDHQTDRADVAVLHWLRPRLSGETAGMRTRRPRSAPLPRSAFAGFRFPPDVIVLAVRWYLRFGLSYRDVEELLTERGVQGRPRHRLQVGTTVHGVVRRRRPVCGHAPGDRWHIDGTYLKVNGIWRCAYRASPITERRSTPRRRSVARVAEAVGDTVRREHRTCTRRVAEPV